MIKIYLLFTACKIATASVCMDHTITVEADHMPTPQQCIQNALPELAKWAEEHPGWRIAKFACTAKKLEEA